jgi:hypothetical protein
MVAPPVEDKRYVTKRSFRRAKLIRWIYSSSVPTLKTVAEQEGTDNKARDALIMFRISLR